MLYLLLILLFLIGGLILFVQKVVMKGRMQRQLGRKVQDRELTSISAWMDASKTNESPDQKK